ncbi:type IV secretion system DNA-binding domain-containing protein [Thermodesulfovibrio sp.]|uniref:type IV secretion system DNA-binding domain-containing protein n=1 Tax=Thermodesulfovibrio sp. TaxID=2067987 RepID=UPI0030AD47A3
MRIKKFQGKNFKELLELVKQELGPDAVILSSKTNKDILSGNATIEITAAVDEGETPSINSLNIEKNDTGLLKELERLKAEVAFLRESVTRLFPSLSDKSKSSLYNFLIKNNIEPHLALILLERVSDIEQLKDRINEEIKTPKRSFEEERGFIIYGAPGTGKTTALYKMGRHLRSKGERVLIVSLDNRISSVASIKEMALNLKCDAKVVKEPKELYKIIHKEIEKNRLLIDTPGDGSANLATELRNLLKDSPLRKCLLLDSTMSKGASLRIMKNMDPTTFDCIGFSKIDLAYNYGNLYNLAVLSDKPVSFISSGAYGEEDSKIMHPQSIKNLILGGICEN